MDYSLPGSSVHGIVQAWVLEWVAISVSRGTSRPEDWTQVSRIAGTLPSEPPGKLFPEMEITQISWKLQNLCLPYFAFFCLPSGTFYLCFLFSTYFAKPTVTFSCSVDQCEWISGLGSQSFQSCLTLYSPMDCNPPGSSVHGIFPARLLEWVAMPSSKGSSWSRDRTLLSCIAGRFFINAPPGNARWISSVQSSSVQSLIHVWLLVTPWTEAHQTFLSITNS